jgi:hypothetical protein
MGGVGHAQPADVVTQTNDQPNRLAADDRRNDGVAQCSLWASLAVISCVATCAATRWHEFELYIRSDYRS